MTKTSVAGVPAYNKYALPALLLGGVLISCSPILVRLAETGPIATAFWRLALAVLPLYLLKPSQQHVDGAAKARSLRDIIILIIPGVVIGAELVVWHMSLELTSVANSTLLVNMSPIFVALGGWLFLRQPISRVFAGGLVLSIVGVFTLKGGSDFTEGDALQGDGLALFAAILYAGYILMLGFTRKRFATSTIMLWTTASAALTVLPVALIFEVDLFPVTLYGWVVLLALAWVTHAAGQSFITFAIAWLPVAFSSLTLLMQPVIAAILAWIFLSEALSVWQMAGGLMVIAGIMLAKRG